MGNSSFQKLFLYHIKLPRFSLKSQQFSIFLQYLGPKILGKNSFGLRQMFSTIWDPNQVKNSGKQQFSKFISVSHQTTLIQPQISAIFYYSSIFEPKNSGKNSFGLRQMFSTLWDPNQVKNYGKQQFSKIISISHQTTLIQPQISAIIYFSSIFGPKNSGKKFF